MMVWALPAAAAPATYGVGEVALDRIAFPISPLDLDRPSAERSDKPLTWWLTVVLIGFCSLQAAYTLIATLLATRYTARARNSLFAGPGAGRCDAAQTAVRRSLTVLIPAFNEADTIEDCLASISRSTLRPDHVIVVDDGSTDDTGERAARGLRACGFGELLCLDQNQGKAQAVNCGLERIETELTFTLDADSRLEPETLTRACASLEAGSLDAIACHIVICLPWRGLTALQGVEYVASLQLARLMQADLGLITTVPGAGALYRTSLLHEMGGFSARSPAEDTDLTLLIQRHRRRIGCGVDAKVRTTPPLTFSGLVRQRERWIWGNLIATACHAVTAKPLSLRFFSLMLPWVAASNGLTPILSIAVLIISAAVLTSDFWWLGVASAILMIALAGLQSVSAFRIAQLEPPGLMPILGSILLMPLIVSAAYVSGLVRRLTGRVRAW